MQLPLFARQNPVDGFTRERFELEQDLDGGCAQAQLVLRDLGLRQTQDAAELGLGQIEAAYLSDSPADSLQVGADKNNLASCSHISCIIHPLDVQPTEYTIDVVLM